MGHAEHLQHDLHENTMYSNFGCHGDLVTTEEIGALLFRLLLPSIFLIGLGFKLSFICNKIINF